MIAWVLYALMSALAGALVAVFGKVGVKDIDPLTATTLRVCVMAGAFLAFVLTTKKFTYPVSMTPVGWLFIFLSGVTGAIGWFSFFAALQMGAATEVLTVDRLSIVFTALLAAFFLGESITPSAVFGMLLVISGTCIIAVK